MGFGQEYQKYGIKEFYSKMSNSYRNPHECDIKKLIQQLAKPGLRYLDLAAGDGIVSSALIDSGCSLVQGCEPFLYELYKNNTGKVCLKYTFEDIAKGALTEPYDVIICSYAMHLVNNSFLTNILYNLSQISDELIILSPHKRPQINNFWILSSENQLNKTKIKVYKKN